MPGGYPPVAGPFWAIAKVTPASNKVAANPIRAEPVMTFSNPMWSPSKEQESLSCRCTLRLAAAINGEIKTSASHWYIDLNQIRSPQLGCDVL